MLRMLFVCHCKPMQTDVQIRTLQKEIWKRCSERNLGGFFVRSGQSLVGLFEGADKTVISLVEHMVRKRRVGAVHVLSETEIDKRAWPAWQSDIYSIEDIPLDSTKDHAGLAQIVKDAVDADVRND